MSSNLAQGVTDQQRGTAEPTGWPSPDRALLTERRVEEALAGIQRAVAVSQFYPVTHPLVVDALADGYRAWQTVESDHRWEDVGLRLRNGTLWLGDACVGAENPAILNLARSLAGHGLVGVRQRNPLGPEGFTRLVQLLATAPDSLAAQGGLAGAWSKTPSASSLELQRLAVSAAEPKEDPRKRPAGRGQEWGQGLSRGADLPALADPLLLSRLQVFRQRGPRERRVLDLLLRLNPTDEITAFLSLLKEIAQITQEYVTAEHFREAYHVALFLYREAQNMDALGKVGKRDYLLDTLRLILRGGFLQWLIGHVTTGRGQEETEVGEYILRALGKSAVVPLINALVTEKDRISRRRLVDILVAIGDPVLPYAVKMLDDQRWYVVRNMVTILGGVASPEALRALSRLAGDPDSRVRREAVRALARVAVPGALELLLSFLADPDSSVRLMAVSIAPAHRSTEMHDALVRMFRSIRGRSADWNLKAAILQAIGRMGLPEALIVLEEVVRHRPFFGRKRWEALQMTAAQALGELGGEAAGRLLGELKSHRNPDVQRAAVRALASLGATPAAEAACPSE
ncbi:MAG: HEAT repeat domain-containing protein [Deltaproteobacteria bacterium]|nr:HEAT repeat domain-containing protein [Deltaproteobacteria bacterium]